MTRDLENLYSDLYWLLVDRRVVTILARSADGKRDHEAQDAAVLLNALLNQIRDEKRKGTEARENARGADPR